MKQKDTDSCAQHGNFQTAADFITGHVASSQKKISIRSKNHSHESEYLRETEGRAFESTTGSTVYFFSPKHENHRVSMKALRE